MKNRFFLTIVFVLIGFIGFAQCTNQVTHFSGTETINGIDVTVIPSGMFEFNDEYCTDTFPYVIGFSIANGNGDGMITFSFTPPIDSLTLNFGGISNSLPNSEMVTLDINGSHYAIPAVGTLNSCGPLAMLTANGDIIACENCTGSGWNNTTIDGPISSLTVSNILLSGFPNGSIFSLFICDPVLGLQDNLRLTDYDIYPNPFSEITTIKTNKTLSNGKILIYNSTGEQVMELDNLFGNQFTIGRGNLSSGLYFLKLTVGGTTLITDKLLIK